MRHLQADRRAHARQDRLRRRPDVDLEQIARLDERAAVVRVAAAQVTGRAARFLAASEPPRAGIGWTSP